MAVFYSNLQHCCSAIIHQVHSHQNHHQLRTFDDKTIKQKYEEQSHHCVYCVDEGNNREYALKELAGDHITPWSLGGKTVPENCQLLCKKHNSSKGNNY
ncbi:HNH endonuclease [Streptococcus suis]|uniref:HNH endonuclease n=1 Tax=Streptococcus suis TaxID=1307 RepID=UPI0009A2A195|nr:HNH endonuclease signature motif containing protein [Streptococcus suis]NQI17266.1 HNH endonuclease [Streptococcus suis]